MTTKMTTKMIRKAIGYCLLAGVWLLGMPAPALTAGNGFVDASGNAFDGNAIMCVTGATLGGKLVVAPCGGPTNPLSVAGKTTTTTATVVTLAAATSAQLIAANPTRKGLRWMVVGANPASIVPGASAAVVGQGMAYSGASGAGQQGGSEAFEGTAVPGDAFQAISTSGTTIIVWEQN